MSLQPESAVPELVSYYHEGLGISIKVPTSWSGQLFEEARVRLLGPPEVAHNDYRPTMDIVAGVPDGDSDEWLKALFAQAGEKMSQTYPQFVLEDESRTMTSNERPMYIRHYRWTEAGTGLQFAQVQALMLQDSDTLFLINGATLKALASEHMPIFDTVLASLRLIPTEATSQS